MPEGSQLYAPMAAPRADRRLVTADEYAHYQSQGFLVCKVSPIIAPVSLTSCSIAG